LRPKIIPVTEALNAMKTFEETLNEIEKLMEE